VSMGLMPRSTLMQLLETPVRFAPLLSRAVVPLAPGCGLVLVDAGFDRFPDRSVATDAARALALATPPKFVLLNEQAVEESAVFMQGPVLDAAVRGWEKIGNRVVAAGKAYHLDTEVVDFINSHWMEWRLRTDELETERTERESQRRASTAETAASGGHGSLGRRFYKEMLPKGFATTLASHFRLPPGQRVADIQRGLCQHISDLRIGVTATTPELLSYVDTVGVQVLAELGASFRERSGLKSREIRRELP